jgi:type II secretory pathway component PulF
VRLSYREKESLYRSLAQLLRSGIPFPSAVEKLLSTAPGRLRPLLDRFHRAMERHEDVGQAFAAQRGTISPMEAGVVAAVERSGRLDHGLQQLADYFGALGQAREALIRNAAYPLFVLHFGILVLGLPTLFTAGVSTYLRDIGTTLLVVYAIAGALAFTVAQVRDAAATNAAMDSFLRRTPLFGKVRRAFALTRFCLIYDLQLDAGVNVMDGLTRAGKASGSGLILPRSRTCASRDTRW